MVRTTGTTWVDSHWITFVVERSPELGLRTAQHLVLTAVSTGLAIFVGVPLGVVATRVRWIQGPVIGTAGILQTIPSLAMLTLLLALIQKIGSVRTHCQVRADAPG
jgi:osmoprotectant transport system permease protein